MYSRHGIFVTAGADDAVFVSLYAAPVGHSAGTGEAGLVYFGASVQPLIRKNIILKRINSFLFISFILP
jgi:nicotinamide mononucleotide (NMN) deamidase PncC